MSSQAAKSEASLPRVLVIDDSALIRELMERGVDVTVLDGRTDVVGGDEGGLAE